MGALHRFEQRLEHAVTGVFARAFRSAVQPMEIAAALQREADNSVQILSRDRRLAPNDFLVELSPVDFDRLSQYGETLAGELAAMLHEHGQQQRYLFAGPLMMHFTRVDELTTGRFRVRSAATAQVTTPAAGSARTPSESGSATTWLEIAGTRTPLRPPGLTIGRGSQADIRVDDPGVSRRHVEIRVQPGPAAPTLSVVDLGSTNGTTVNGRRVQHAILRGGDVVQVGATRIVLHVEQPSGANAPQPDAAGADRPAGPASTPQTAPHPPGPYYPPQPYPPPPYAPQSQPHAPYSPPPHRQQPPYRMPDPPAAPAGPDHHHWSG